MQREALEAAAEDGIVFLDEIDKVTARSEREGAGAGGVSHEGVQRDLLPLIQGTTVATKYGPVTTDHILFIASGAFQAAKPSDLMPELQGRLPIRVELRALTKQYVALLGTEGVEGRFDESGVKAIARIAAEVNAEVENIGARRFYTVIERVFEDLSSTAPDRAGETVVVDAAMVEAPLGNLAKATDVRRDRL